MDWMDGAVCCFDTEFPVVNVNAPNGDRPYLLFYKGDLSLLNDLNRNVAVIGYTTPTDEQIARESKIVEQLVNHNQHIVSGLAKGCDGIAHTICMDCGGKTIAILPSPLNSIFPAAHRDMAQRIVETGGLIITEYYDEPHSRHEAINRFVERDRLQALFAKAVILIASYEGRDGDSGSRHAMAKANKYGHMACVMYNAATDGTARDMKLNRSLLELQQARQLVAAKSKSDTSAVTLEEIVQFVNPMLEMADTLF
ncbi:DNA-processing protein DprA [uncultured Veillonella sp.]|uniref:DNA-processing protein DprA n=1 Tax=uncultured Veillonella sp. TaxID=159268 RepID=UPI00345076BB